MHPPFSKWLFDSSYSKYIIKNYAVLRLPLSSGPQLLCKPIILQCERTRLCMILRFQKSHIITSPLNYRAGGGGGGGEVVIFLGEDKKYYYWLVLSYNNIIIDSN